MFFVPVQNPLKIILKKFAKNGIQSTDGTENEYYEG
jgi:hypothetical protein